MVEKKSPCSIAVRLSAAESGLKVRKTAIIHKNRARLSVWHSRTVLT